MERSLYLQRLARLVNVEERVLLEALAREPMRRAPRLAPVPVGPGVGTGSLLGPSPLEREALSLLLRYPALMADLPADEPLPFRDAAAGALVVAWRERVGQGAGTGADLEAFVGGLDPASAGLARDLLGHLAANGDATPLDPEEARNELRVCLLRLRMARIDEAMRDGRLLLEEAQRDEDRGRLQALEQQISQLGRQKADVTKAIRDPAQAVGVRRN